MKLFCNKKNYKCSGFTLSEVLMAIAIIGIGIAISLSTIKPSQRKIVSYLYANAYNSLSVAYYNGLVGGYNPFTTENTPVHGDNNDTGTEILCKALTSFINTPTNKRTDDGDYSNTCSSANVASLTPSEDYFKPKAANYEEPHFVASNGMKFYTSKLIEDNDPNNPEPLPFYIVYIDINGDKGPNSLIYTYDIGHENEEKHKIIPDVYAFALLDNGKVCPIGIPEFDTDVMTARVAYSNKDNNTEYTKKSLPYYQAKSAAWGYYSRPEVNVLEKANIDDVFTMNDRVRDKLKKVVPNTDILKDFPDFKDLGLFIQLLEDDTHNCSIDDYDSCYVFLDGYRQY